MENKLSIGQTEDGYSFIGGDPADKNSWKKVGEVEDGYTFIGGDPAKKESWSMDAPKEEELKPDLQTSGLEAVAGGIAEGGTLGFAGEAMGGIKALGAKLGLIDSKSKSVFDEGVNLKDEYQAQRDAHQDYLDTLEKEHKKKYMGGQMVGAVGSGIATGGAGATNLLARAGIEGGLYGLGSSKADLMKGDIKEYGKAALDTGIGATTGLVTAGLFKGGGKLYNKYFKKGAQDFAENTAAKGSTEMLQATPGEIAKLKAKGGYKDLPKFLREKGFKGNKEDLAKTLKETTDEAGEQISKIADDYDGFYKALESDIKSGNLPKMEPHLKNLQREAYDFGKIANDLEKDVLSKIQGIPNLERDAAKVASYINKLRKLGKVNSLKELNKQRQGIDSMINYDRLNQKASIMEDVFRTIRKSISSHVKDKMLPQFDKTIATMAKEFEINASPRIMNAAEKLTAANRDYFMASNVKDILKKAAGRDKSMITKTDLLTGSLSGMASLASGNPLVLGIPLAKKAAEVALPKARYAAPKILGAAEKVGGVLQKGLDVVEPYTRPAVTQQVTDKILDMKESRQPKKPEPEPWEAEDTPASPSQAAKGTKYESVFQGEDTKQHAVNHKVLMQTDPEYRKRFLKKKA